MPSHHLLIQVAPRPGVCPAPPGHSLSLLAYSRKQIPLRGYHIWRQVHKRCNLTPDLIGWLLPISLQSTLSAAMKPPLFKWMLLLPIALLGTLVVAISAITPASATQCTLPESVEEKIEWADVIFLGTVIDKTYVDDQFKTAYSTFAVERVWKGDVGETVAVKAAEDSYWLGYTFKWASQYLVYASDGIGDNPDYGTGLCSGNVLVNRGTVSGFEAWPPPPDGEVMQDLAVLGSGTSLRLSPAEDETQDLEVLGSGTSSQPPPLWGLWLAAATAIGLLGLIVFGVVRWQIALRKRPAPMRQVRRE